jgi:hypothetical protein
MYNTLPECIITSYVLFSSCCMFNTVPECIITSYVLFSDSHERLRSTTSDFLTRGIQGDFMMDGERVSFLTFWQKLKDIVHCVCCLCRVEATIQILVGAWIQVPHSTVVHVHQDVTMFCPTILYWTQKITFQRL